MIGHRVRTLVLASVAALVLAGCTPAGFSGATSEGERSAVAQFRQLAAGEYHTCGVDVDAGAWCWGQGLYGQLGNGDTVDTTSPVRVVADSTRFTAITAGSMHTCALDDRGAVWCWGGNFVGRLGTGDREPTSTPTRVEGIDAAVRNIHAGLDRTCAVTVDDALWCWGANNERQINDSTTGDILAPVRITPGPVTDVSMRAGRTCLIADTVRCQGGDLRSYVLTGEVAYGLWEFQGLPTGVSQLAQTRFGYCGLLADAVWCWGAYLGGQAPTGAITGSIGAWLDPEVRPGITATALAASEDTMCALEQSRTLRCSGLLAAAQVSDESMAQFVPVALPEPVVSVVGGSTHLCALADSGRAWCWGDNSYGQLGNGSREDAPSPATSVG